MSKSEETKCRDECLNEAYVEDDIILGGACAADTFAGPGKDEWAPKAHARRAGFSKARKSSKTTSDLSKRVRQLERELLKKQTRGASPRNQAGVRKGSRPSRRAAVLTARQAPSQGRHHPALTAQVVAVAVAGMRARTESQSTTAEANEKR